ncbi:40S ribosomal protein S15a, partial [Bos mutus]
NVPVDALKRINNGKRREVNDRFQSGHVPKIIIRLLTMMMKRSYIDKFEIIDNHRAGKIVNLTGRRNKWISPRFDVQFKELEKLHNNLLPSCQSPFIVLTISAELTSWTMKKQDENTQEGKSLDSFSR